MTINLSVPGSVFSMREILAEQVQRLEASGSNLHIPQLIKESDLNVLSFDEKIASLRMQITTLVELRDRELAVRAVLQHLIAPIRTLPVEILSEIFLLTVWGATQYTNSHIRAAYRVFHVCSEWRHVAVTTPHLWTGQLTLYVNRIWTDLEDEIFAAGLREWLARSAPLSVPIILNAGIDEDNRVRTLEEVTRVASRWQYLEFHCRGAEAISLLEKLDAGSLVSLEEIHLWTNITPDVEFDPMGIQCFSTACALTSLSMHPSCQVPMPWGQLTELTLTFPGTSELVANILAKCPNLIFASLPISSWTGWQPLEGGNDVVVLNHLRTLALDFLDVKEGPHAMCFMEHLCAPVLDDLRLYFDLHPDQDWDEASFATFQSRSPNLTKLDIDILSGNLCIPSQAFQHIFLDAPLLSHLSFSSTYSSDVTLFELLTYSDLDAQPLLPQLCSLSFSRIQFGVVGDALASMIRLRWWTDEELASRQSPPRVARWSKVYLRDAYNDRQPANESFRNAMQSLRLSGLQVNV
ncbi:F-box domain-containing protein [Favolaschia claudopus]|uniref:F-box domain-containing protein n=1 Tax=Favolaschia claudopus TaxID=2862362 RepID=A0AAW0E7F9_9AGAR